MATNQILYTVTATFPAAALRDRYVKWLAGGHISAVLNGGALSGEVVRMDQEDANWRVMVAYKFSTRAAFDRYVEVCAPALRAEGLREFPPESGITFKRAVGEVVWAEGR